MNVQISQTKLVALYIEVDDLLKAYQSFLLQKKQLLPGKPTRSPGLNSSEVCTIWLCTTYQVIKPLNIITARSFWVVIKSWFPDAPCYERFLSYIPRNVHLLCLWLFYSCALAKKTGLYFIDSKKLPVCHIKREHSHQVFKGITSKGKSPTGYFYGLKLHLTINNLGQITPFLLTPGNVADNNKTVLMLLLGGLKGVCVRDKRYLTTLFQQFYENGLELVKKPKRNMRSLPVPHWKNKLINMRPVIESVFDIMGTVCDIDHTRHRSPINAISHVLAGLIAYQSLEQKPAVFFPSMGKHQENSMALAA